MASPINPSSIPPITALRKELDYGDPRLPRCQAFSDSVRVFQKTFVSSQGWDGSFIHDWKSQEHQTALGEMVRSYLELQNNGILFWPDDVSQSFANKYMYSTDSARIKRIMRQLFWRLNIQQYRNRKYRGKKDKVGKIGANRQRSPSHDLGLDTDVVGAATASGDDARTPGTPRSATVVSLADSPVDAHTGAINPDSRQDQSHTTNEREISQDLYRVPDSPDPRVLPPPNQPIFSVMSTGIGNDGGQVAPVANMEPSTSTKQARGDDRGDNRGSARMSSKRAGKRPAGPSKSRVSLRKRKLRNMTGLATEEQVFAALESPERNPSPEVVHEPAPPETNNVVTSDILPPWAQRPANRSRATVSEVTDEDMSVNGFVSQLNAETGLDPTEPSNGTNHAGPSAQVTPNGAAPQPSIEVKPATRQSSPISLISSALPEDREAVDERPNEKMLANQAPPPRQAQVEFLYRVVCRHPELQSVFWKPEGSFRSKTLSTLEEELPIHLEWSRFQYLHFRLVAPHARAEHLVCRGREDQFDAVKRYLTDIIRDCIANAPCGKTVLAQIDIEPLSDVTSLRKSMEGEVMDFDW